MLNFKHISFTKKYFIESENNNKVLNWNETLPFAIIVPFGPKAVLCYL